MRSGVVVLAGVAALAVGGGATAQDRQVTVVVKPVERQKGFEKVKVSKAAIGDTQIILWQNAAINPDCSAVPGVTLSILRPPEHGKATISDDGVFAAFPPANPRSACNNHKVPGHQALYQAQTGYTGRDRLVLQGSSPEGHVREIDIDIDVR